MGGGIFWFRLQTTLDGLSGHAIHISGLFVHPPQMLTFMKKYGQWDTRLCPSAIGLARDPKNFLRILSEIFDFEYFWPFASLALHGLSLCSGQMVTDRPGPLQPTLHKSHMGSQKFCDGLFWNLYTGSFIGS